MTRDDWKKLPRLYVAAPLAAEAAVALDAKQAHYLRHVMRRAAGDRVLLFNGADGEWLAGLAAKGKTLSAICLERTRTQQAEDDLWLLFAPLKRDHLEFLVQKATELGASRLIPVITQHTVAGRVNLDRLLAIAVEAAEQCERLSLPEIAPPLPLAEALAAITPPRLLFACLESGAASPIGAALSRHRSASAAFLTGPEGGFNAEEMALIRDHAGSVPVHLGPRILRADTAALMALAAWQTLRGDDHPNG